MLAQNDVVVCLVGRKYCRPSPPLIDTRSLAMRYQPCGTPTKSKPFQSWDPSWTALRLSMDDARERAEMLIEDR